MLNWSIDQHETGQYFLKFSSSYKSHSSEGVGEGIVSAFVIAAALYDSSAGDVIVIDEPELSLHPQIQKRMMSVFEDLSVDRQIIISTHSPYFITASVIRNGMTICRSWDRNNSVALHSISKSDTPSLAKLATPNINNPHIFGLDAKEVFFLEDGVLIFEGQEDVVLWPEISRQLDAPLFQVYGWGAGGAENITNVLSVLRGLGFERVAAILDADKPTELARLKMDFPEYHIDAIPADDIRTKKPSPARDGKVGLLDERRIIRKEFEDECRSLIHRVSEKICIN